MKKIIGFVLIAVIISVMMGLCGCSEKEENKSTVKSASDNITVYGEADYKELSERAVYSLFETANDKAYIKAVIGNLEESKNIISEYSKTKIDTNEAAYVITCKDFDYYLELTTGSDADAFSDVMKKKLEQGFSSGILSMINSKAGINYISASSALQYQQNYVADGIVNKIWIFPTDKKGVFVYTDFKENGENVLTVTAGFLHSEQDLAEYNFLNIERESIKLNPHK